MQANHSFDQVMEMQPMYMISMDNDTLQIIEVALLLEYMEDRISNKARKMTFRKN